MRYTLFIIISFFALSLWGQDFVVPTDGNFVDAIHAANNRSNTSKRFIILIKEGTHYSHGDRNTISNVVKDSQGNDSTIYFESPMVTLTAPNTTIKGEGMDKSIVENRPVNEGIGITSTLFVDHADNTIIEDLTLWCNFNNDINAFANRAVALNEKGCKNNRLKNVRLKSTQDTYFTNNEGSTRLDNCEIIGTVDFICGGGKVHFNNCTIIMVPRGNTGNRDVICAPATTDDEFYVFNNCTIDGSPEQEGRFHLARPWRNAPKCIWINTTMKKHPAIEGYCEMHGRMPSLFAEYNSKYMDGTPIDCSQRKNVFGDAPISYNPILTKKEAKKWLKK